MTWARARRTKNTADGSPTGGMESAASYSGSTNPGGTFKYGVDMDFMGCMVMQDGYDQWVDARCCVARAHLSDRMHVESWGGCHGSVSVRLRLSPLGGVSFLARW